MSLIEEALRRVQAPKLAKAVATPPQKPSKESPAPEEPPTHSWPVAPMPTLKTPSSTASPRSIMPLVALLVGVAVGSWVIGVAWLARSPQPVSARPRNTQPRVRAPSQTAPMPVASPPAAPSLLSHRREAAPSMVLSGVVVGSGDPYAMIDGRIVGIGEQVGNGTVEEITQQQVKLRLANGSETVLQVAR